MFCGFDEKFRGSYFCSLDNKKVFVNNLFTCRVRVLCISLYLNSLLAGSRLGWGQLFFFFYFFEGGLAVYL